MGGRNFLVIALLTLLPAGCSNSPGVQTAALSDATAHTEAGENSRLSGATASSASEYARTYMDFKLGAIDSAETRLKLLLHSADSAKDETYIRSSLYNRRAEYASGLAWAAIERGDIEGGRRQFADAVRTLVQDEQQLVTLTHDDDQKKQMAGTIVSLGLIGLAAGLDYKNVQAGTYQANTSMLSTLQNSGMVKLLSQPVNTTDQLQLFIGPQPRETDGVRMIVMPALNGPMSLIGRVKWQKSDTLSGLCTGGLVGPRTVLTAAHCFTEGYRKALESEVTFTISSPSYTNTAKVRAIITPTEILRGGDQENDWALLQLDHNPSASQDYLIADDSFDPSRKGSRWSPALASKLYLAGYSSDLNDGRFITLAAGCSFGKAIEYHNAIHHCPSWKGASGSPVIVKHGKAGHEAYHVIGVHDWGMGEMFDPMTIKGMRLITANLAEAIRRANAE